MEQAELQRMEREVQAVIGEKEQLGLKVQEAEAKAVERENEVRGMADKVRKIEERLVNE